MLKAGGTLKELFPNLLHVTCVVHGINRVAELIGTKNSHADRFIIKAKGLFTRCVRRKRIFQNLTALRLPPEPVVTRWNTWPEACFHYGEHFDEFKQFVEYMNNEEEPGSPVFSTLLDMMNETVLREEISFIVPNSQFLTSAITELLRTKSRCCTSRICY